MSNRIMLPGVALCSPFAQGDLDNLCGIYATVNALCLTSAPIRPLSRVEARHLLHSGVTYLSRRGWLSDAFIYGMALQQQRAVTQHMAKTAARLTDLDFAATPVIPRTPKLNTNAALQLLASSIAAGSAVVTCLENTFWHYTVISGVSASRVYLFDSDGLHWIERRSFGIYRQGCHARHQVPRASLIKVSITKM